MGVDNRRSTRFRCRVPVEICAGGTRCNGHVLDLSESGMRIATDEVLNVWRGDAVEIRGEEFGLLQATARWRAPRMLGVELQESTNTLAKVTSYFKNYGRDMTPTSPLKL